MVFQIWAIDSFPNELIAYFVKKFPIAVFIFLQFSSVQSLSHVQLFATPWITARQACLSITNSQSLLKLMPIESAMPSSHLILCCPLLLLPPVPPSIRVFSNESTLHMRWPKYWSFSFSISPSNLYFLLVHKSFWFNNYIIPLVTILIHRLYFFFCFGLLYFDLQWSPAFML